MVSRQQRRTGRGRAPRARAVALSHPAERAAHPAHPPNGPVRRGALDGAVLLAAAELLLAGLEPSSLAKGLPLAALAGTGAGALAGTALARSAGLRFALPFATVVAYAALQIARMDAATQPLRLVCGAVLVGTVAAWIGACRDADRRGARDGR